jgi:hypothetical protein
MVTGHSGFDACLKVGRRRRIQLWAPARCYRRQCKIVAEIVNLKLDLELDDSHPNLVIGWSYPATKPLQVLVVIAYSCVPPQVQLEQAKDIMVRGTVL